jgi:phospholipase C
VVPSDQTDVALPAVTAKLRAGSRPDSAEVELRLANDGDTAVTFTLTPNDFGGRTQTVLVEAGHRAQPTWPSDRDGRYDFTVSAGTGTRFAQRYAGTVHSV